MSLPNTEIEETEFKVGGYEDARYGEESTGTSGIIIKKITTNFINLSFLNKLVMCF